MNTGFIGLGVMGNPMCKNLLKKGNTVLAFDINEKAIEEVVESGASAAANTRQVGENCRVIITMLPRDQHVQAVYEELFSLSPQKRIYIDMSTISPAVSRRLAQRAEERGEIFLDAPVVKSHQAAVEGTLGIYVGGDRAGFEEVRPLLECMGSSILYLGGNGAGLVMKLCHNMLVGQIQNGVNEMLTLAEKAGGIDVATFAEAVSCGGGKNFYLESKTENLSQRNFETAFAVEYMHKDVHLALDLCEENGLKLEGAGLIGRRYDKAMQMGLGKKDFSSTILLFEDEKQ